MFGILRPLSVLLVAAMAAGCTNPSSAMRSNPSNPSGFLSNPSNPSGGSSGARSAAVIIPNAVAGDAAARGVVDPTTQGAGVVLTTDQQRQLYEQRRCQADRIWQRAVQLECSNPGMAAQLFETVVDDYPEFEQAAEARFREGRAYYRARQYGKAATALQEYMRLAPVNPHLAEVEELLYESGVRYVNRRKRFFGIFSGDQEGLDALSFVSETFTAGTYADDALLALGDYFRKEGEWMAAVLHYKELLLRYPDSEWSFKARLRLADTYFCRDQGVPYNAGYVVLDPREPVPEAALIMGGPIESAVELALEQYEIYLERMEADPGRKCEYAREVEYARCQVQKCREALAAKDLDRGDWYRSRGEQCAAIGYWRGAAWWTDTCAGKTAAERIQAATGQAYQAGTAPCPLCPEAVPVSQRTRPAPNQPAGYRPPSPQPGTSTQPRTSSQPVPPQPGRIVRPVVPARRVVVPPPPTPPRSSFPDPTTMPGIRPPAPGAAPRVPGVTPSAPAGLPPPTIRGVPR